MRPELSMQEGSCFLPPAFRYWLMCAGDKAYACETSLVGSIGVISATFGAQVKRPLTS